MDAYIYNADIYCEQCGERIKARLDAEGHTPKNPDDERTFDSSEYPKGPFSDGGGEADTPQHCGEGEKCLNALVLSDGTKVGCMLENDLTQAGAEYVKEYLRDDPDSEVVQLWANFYRECL